MSKTAHTWVKNGPHNFYPLFQFWLDLWAVLVRGPFWTLPWAVLDILKIYRPFWFMSRFGIDPYSSAGAGVVCVHCAGAFQVEMNRQSNKHRTIQCYYNPTEPGTYMIYVNWSGDPVPHSPFRVYIAENTAELQRYESGHTTTATSTHRQAGPNAVNGADFYEDDVVD